MNRKKKIGLLETYQFGTSSLKACPEQIKFYTGFESYDMLKATFLALQPTAETMIRWSQFQRNNGCIDQCSKKGFSSKVPPFEQFFVFNCFLKAGLMETDLSYRKKVSGTTTSRIIITWETTFTLLWVVYPFDNQEQLLTSSCQVALKSYFPNVE